MAASPLPPPQNGTSTHKFAGCSGIGQYDILHKLGEGTFGEVHKAISKKTGAVVALKKILMHNEKDGFPVTAIREIKLLKLLSHRNVLKLEEMAMERPQGPGKQKAIMYMVTPYMDHDLAGLLENPDVQFTEPQIKCYTLQLLEGLRYIHSNHILHRDMKAANLLISNKGILQIADFGLARHYDEPVPQRGQGGGEARRDYTTLVVTRWYRPPELLLQLRRYTTAIDMWGVGCVFGEMFKRQPILAGKSDIDQAQLIFDMVGSPSDTNMPGWSELPGCEGVQNFDFRKGNLREQFKDLNEQALSFLSDCLTLNWRTRLTAIDGLSHQYFKTRPYAAKPEDLPVYSDSHELDRRKARGDKKTAPPPAPAGGTVGMGANGEWAGPSGPSSGAYASGPPSRDYRAGPPRPNAGGYGGGSGPRPPPYDSRGGGGFEQRGSRVPPAAHSAGPPRAAGWNQQPRYGNELPPRPPPAAYPPPRGHSEARDRGSANGNGNGVRGSSKDTYIPAYENGGPPRDERRERERSGPPRERGWERREHRGDRDVPSDRERDRPAYHDRHGGAGLEYDNHDRNRGMNARSGGGYDDRERDRRRDSGGGGGGGGNRDRRERDGGGGGGGQHYGNHDRRRTRSRSPVDRRSRDRDRDRERDGREYRR